MDDCAILAFEASRVIGAIGRRGQRLSRAQIAASAGCRVIIRARMSDGGETASVVDPTQRAIDAAGALDLDALMSRYAPVSRRGADAGLDRRRRR